MLRDSTRSKDEVVTVLKVDVALSRPSRNLCYS